MTSSTQDARDAAQKAAGAANGTEFLGSAGAALTATSTALAAAKEYATTVLSAASGSGDTVRSAFARAQSCAALNEKA